MYSNSSFAPPFSIVHDYTVPEIFPPLIFVSFCLLWRLAIKPTSSLPLPPISHELYLQECQAIRKPWLLLPAELFQDSVHSLPLCLKQLTTKHDYTAVPSFNLPLFSSPCLGMNSMVMMTLISPLTIHVPPGQSKKIASVTIHHSLKSISLVCC